MAVIYLACVVLSDEMHGSVTETYFRYIFRTFLKDDSVMLCGLLKSYIKLLAAFFKRSFSAV